MKMSCPSFLLEAKANNSFRFLNIIILQMSCIRIVNNCEEYHIIILQMSCIKIKIVGNIKCVKHVGVQKHRWAPPSAT